MIPARSCISAAAFLPPPPPPASASLPLQPGAPTREQRTSDGDAHGAVIGAQALPFVSAFSLSPSRISCLPGQDISHLVQLPSAWTIR